MAGRKCTIIRIYEWLLQAVKAVCTLEAKQAAAQAQMTSCGLKKQPFVKNTFKCSRCMRVYHPSGSPLVLCDYCPKAFHVSCLQGATMADLPAGEWACPKCHEKQAANKQKLEDLAAKHKEALERVATVCRCSVTSLFIPSTFSSQSFWCCR